jgi:hypothetical protein
MNTVCKHGNEWSSRHRFLGTGHIEFFDAEVWAIKLALNLVIEKRDTLLMPGVKTVAVFSDSQAAIQLAAHLQPDPGQSLPSRIN